jgi:hypothetical protein
MTRASVRPTNRSASIAQSRRSGFWRNGGLRFRSTGSGRRRSRRRWNGWYRDTSACASYRAYRSEARKRRLRRERRRRQARSCSSKRVDGRRSRRRDSIRRSREQSPPPSTNPPQRQLKHLAAVRRDRGPANRSRKLARKVWKQNADKNGGQNRCELCKQPVVKPQQHAKGVTPPKNEGHVDHRVAQSKSGSGTPENGDMACRSCNLKKGNK